MKSKDVDELFSRRPNSRNPGWRSANVHEVRDGKQLNSSLWAAEEFDQRSF
jgi:hypothetical protein